jgi:hypothetical protein
MPPNPAPTDSTPVRIKVNPKDIIYVHGIIEAYDHLAVVRTLDNKNGILELLASPSFLEDLHALLNALSGEIALEMLNVDVFD